MANKSMIANFVCTEEMPSFLEPYHDQLKQLDTDNYNVYEWTVSKLIDSRCRYTHKLRKELVKRYMNLMDDAGLDSWPEIQDIDNDIRETSSYLRLDSWPEIQDIDNDIRETSSYLLISHCSDQKEFSDMMSFVTGACQIENAAKLCQIREIIQHRQKTPFVITFSEDVVNNTQEAFQSAIFILVVKDKKYRSEFSKTFSDRKNVHVCLREDVEQILSTHPERCAFTGMKDLCEFLQTALPTPDSLGDICDAGLHEKTQRLTTRKRQHSATDMSTFESAKKQSKTNGQRQHSTEDTSPFAPDHKRRKTSPSLLELGKENKEIKKRTERLVHEIVGMFNRSNLPKDEHPSLCSAMQLSINENLIQGLRTLSESIRSCRYRFSTFEVCVDERTILEQLKYDIEGTLKTYNITDYSIISSRIKTFANVQVGSKVSAGRFTGTLGGFAQTSEEKSKRLWVLTSRHLTNFSSEGNIYIDDGRQNISAKVMEQLKDYKPKRTYLDIAAASLEEGVEKTATRDT